MNNRDNHHGERGHHWNAFLRSGRIDDYLRYRNVDPNENPESFR